MRRACMRPLTGRPLAEARLDAAARTASAGGSGAIPHNGPSERTPGRTPARGAPRRAARVQAVSRGSSDRRLIPSGHASSRSCRTGHRGRGGRWRDHRQVIDAIAFKYRTGTPWMDLPEQFGSWKGVRSRRVWRRRRMRATAMP
ncbi:transposase [Streptomyces nojiriensis]|uniref:transposase n=1 Tax=Streptomyces nojiriensis TaxID=66374 RepID=UPI0036513311